MGGSGASGVDGSPQGGSRTTISVTQAAFIGIGAMVGAGIFALLGEAGAVAGSAVWVSFLIGGVVALFQGYSFVKLGSKYSSGAGLLEYLYAGFGDGRLAGTGAFVGYASSLVVMAMVSVTFGGYAAALFVGEGASAATEKLFALAGLLLVLLVNVIGRATAAKVGAWLVWPVIVILAGFSLLSLPKLDSGFLAPSTYPSMSIIFSSVALTFFAYIGFGVVTFAGADLRDPERELPRAMYLSIGLTTILYVAISLAVFGALGPDGVIAAGETALAKAAEVVFGAAAFGLMSIVALLASATSVNSTLYPASGLTGTMAAQGRFPAFFGSVWGARKLPAGLFITAGLVVVVGVFLDLTAIASLGSTVSLLLFLTISVGHIRIRKETGASLWILVLAVLTTGATLISFASTELKNQPATVTALVVVLVVSFVTDAVMRRARRSQPEAP